MILLLSITVGILFIAILYVSIGLWMIGKEQDKVDKIFKNLDELDEKD